MRGSTIAIHGVLERIDLHSLCLDELLVVLVEILHQDALQLVDVYIAAKALLYVQADATEAIVRHAGAGGFDHHVWHFVAEQDDVERFASCGVDSDGSAEDLRVGEIQLFVDERPYLLVKDGVAEDAIGEVKAGDDGAGDDDHHVAPNDHSALLVEELLVRILQHPHHDVGGEADEDRIDEIEVEGAEEVAQVARRQAEAGGAEGRHEGGGDGHAGDDVTLRLGGAGHDAGQAAEEGDEHVVDGRRGACQQLALRLADGRDEEVNGGRDDAEERCRKVAAQGALNQVEVRDAEAQPEAHDGAHERGDKHGADDDGRGVGVQPERGQEDGEDEDPEVGAAKLDAFLQ